MGVGAPFGAHALAAQKADATCVTIPVAGQNVCVPPDGVPGLPGLPSLPGVPVRYLITVLVTVGWGLACCVAVSVTVTAGAGTDD